MSRAILRAEVLRPAIVVNFAAAALLHALSLPASAQVCAYVTHDTDGMVSVINTEAKMVTSTVSVGGSPTDVAVLPGGSLAYVTNTDPDSVSVIDTVGKTVIKTIDIPECTGPLCGPEAIGITSSGLRAYVSSPVDSGAHVLSVIDTATNTVTNSVTIRANAVARGGGVGIPPAGHLGCLSGYALDPPGAAQPNVLMYLDVLDTNTNMLTHRNFPLGPAGAMQDFLDRAHTSIAVTSAGVCYVSNAFTGNLLLVPTATNSIRSIALVSMPPVPVTTGVAITPDGHFVYVSGGTKATPPASLDKGEVFVIDTSTNLVTSFIQLGGHFFTDVALSPDGAFALVTDRDGDRVFVIDTATKTVTFISVASGASSVTIASVPNGCPVVSKCVGDCDNTGHVTVTQILKMVNIALGNLPLSACPAGDAEPDGRITVGDIIKAVNNALGSCPAT